MDLIVKIIFVTTALRVAPLMTLGVAFCYAGIGWPGNLIGAICFVGGIVHMLVKFGD